MGAAAVFDDRLRLRIVRIGAAALLMGVVLYLVRLWLGEMLFAPAVRYGALSLLVAAGAGSYALFASGLGAFRFSELRGAVRRH